MYDWNCVLREKATVYSGTWELGTPMGLWKTVLNSEVVSFLSCISVFWIGLGTGVAALNSQVVPISQVVLNMLKTGFTVIVWWSWLLLPDDYRKLCQASWDLYGGQLGRPSSSAHSPRSQRAVRTQCRSDSQELSFKHHSHERETTCLIETQGPICTLYISM